MYSLVPGRSVILSWYIPPLLKFGVAGSRLSVVKMKALFLECCVVGVCGRGFDVFYGQFEYVWFLTFLFTVLFCVALRIEGGVFVCLCGSYTGSALLPQSRFVFLSSSVVV